MRKETTMGSIETPTATSPVEGGSPTRLPSHCYLQSRLTATDGTFLSSVSCQKNKKNGGGCCLRSGLQRPLFLPYSFRWNLKQLNTPHVDDFVHSFVFPVKEAIKTPLVSFVFFSWRKSDNRELLEQPWSTKQLGTASLSLPPFFLLIWSRRTPLFFSPLIWSPPTKSKPTRGRRCWRTPSPFSRHIYRRWPTDFLISFMFPIHRSGDEMEIRTPLLFICLLAA